MKSKCSPGPWSTGDGYPEVNRIADANGVFIADASDRSSEANDGQRKANARLFSAAYDLAASLHELVNSPNAKQNACWDRARAALKKAGVK